MIKLSQEKRVLEPIDLEVTEEQWAMLYELFDGAGDKVTLTDVDVMSEEWAELEEAHQELHDKLKQMCDDNDYEITLAKRS